ncbi:MAG: NAD kinase [Prevotellaceae bacterium]|nr:NAD kinase [Prevotellaceae bacterium]
MKVAIFGNSYKTENLSLLPTLFEVLARKGASSCMEKSFYDFVRERSTCALPVELLNADEPFTADLAVSIGGDGTFLRTAVHVGRKGIPIIGINTGRLGFLADIASTDIVQPFEQILDRNFVIEERDLLELRCEQGGEIVPLQHNIALNEVAVLKQDSSSMIGIRTCINGEHLITYQGDGLLVATPTGSTAYSMSVGGPLLVPQAKNIILTPIASHSLTVRPLVITNDYEISLTVSSRTNSFLASVDGCSTVFHAADDTILHIKKADYSIKVVKQKDHNFFNTLRNKLMWGVDKREIRL